MHWFDVVRLRLRSLFRRERVDQELDAELQFAIHQRIEHHIAAGMSATDARVEARLAFGCAVHVREACRDVRGLNLVDDLMQDVRYALRSFGNTPGYTGVVVVTLALGIGANTSIFSVVNSVLLRPLPFAEADRLVRIVENVPAEQTFSGRPMRRPSMYIYEFVDWRARTQTLSHLAVHIASSMTLSGRGEAVRLTGARVSPELFSMFGAQAQLGRVFVADEEQGGDTVVILSDGTWRRRFAADPDIVGSRLTLDGESYTVVGVMGSTVEFPTFDGEFWTPFVPSDNEGAVMPVMGRLADGATLDAASAEINTFGLSARGLPPSTGAPLGPTRFEVVRVKDEMVAPVRDGLLVLAAAAGFVLLIACVNVASLVLARSASRRREIAIRCAIGAGRSRVIRQVLTESTVLAVAGGIVGLCLAFGGVRLVQTLTTVDGPEWFLRSVMSVQRLPRVGQVEIDLSVLTFAFGTCVVTGLFFGLAPALQLSRLSLMHVIHDGTASGTAGLRLSNRLSSRSVLVIVEVTLATVLLIGGGLLMRSFLSLSNVPLGYDPTNVLTFEVVSPTDQGGDDRSQLDIADALIRRLEPLAQVESVGFTHFPLLAGLSTRHRVTVAGAPQDAPPEQLPETRFVSQRYLSTLGVSVLDGRGFGDQDSSGAPKVLLANRAFARLYLGNANPVGSVITTFDVDWRVVGIVDDVRQQLGSDPEPTLYFDYRQLPPAARLPPIPLQYVVRSSGRATDLVPNVRGLVSQIDRRAALDSIATLEGLVSSSVARPRFYAVLVGIFALVAVALATIGVYGVMAYSVTQRTQEIGIRMALGAQRRHVLSMVVGQGIVLTGVGILLGLAGAFTLTRYLANMLFGLTPLDPSTFLALSGAFVVIAAGAAYLPARRAANLDPFRALRQD
jgi:predicted permease